MKLYAEEQVMNALRLAHSHIKPLQYVVDTLIPIELPSNEEIEDESNKEYQEQEQSYENSIEFFSFNNSNYLKSGFVEGAKWIRNKIQGGQK